MSMTKERANVLIAAIAAAFIVKAEAKTPSESFNDTVLDIIDEFLLAAKITFKEAIDIMYDHKDDLQHKVVELAHEKNSSHDCNTCVLMYLCNPDAEEKEMVSGLKELLDLLTEAISDENKKE